MKCVSTMVAVALFGLLGAVPCFALSEIQAAGAGLTEDLQPKEMQLTEDPPPQQLLVQRAKTKLRVRPAYPHREYHSVYPVPYSFDYPGPNAKRECLDRYVTEHRPSGTVIVARMRCRWVRG